MSVQTFTYPATVKQLAFLAKLAGERNMPVPAVTSKREATQAIARLIDTPRPRAAAPAVRAAAPAAPAVPAGRYAITVEGEPLCYEVSIGAAEGKWAGYVFLNRMSGPDEWPIRNRDQRARILSTISQDVEGAAVLAAHTLSRCIRCGRRLTDIKNPFYGVGLGPECGKM
jgi:hypothetical protein